MLRTLIKEARACRDCLPEFFPLPHPRPRNRLWLKRNPWFVKEVVRALRHRLRAL